MTISASVATPGVLGHQLPRVSHWPDYVSSAGEEAVELARMAGLELDPWEELVLRHALGERPDGKWAARSVGLLVSRQNGKGAILEARELAGLFLLGERLLIHSAHLAETSLEHFERLVERIENTPELVRRVKRVSRTNGKEGITLTTGQRIKFRTRTKGGGRGLSGDFVALDEAMEIPETVQGAMLPLISARPNPQVWYTGSAVDEWHHENGVVFARIRERGIAGDPTIAWFDWSADAESPDDVTAEMAADSDVWAQANPALGIRITTEAIEEELRSSSRRTFAVERLGVGQWPRTDEEEDQVLDAEGWKGCADPESTLLDPVFLTFDVTPRRDRASIGAGGKREDGLPGVELIERKKGTGWLPERIAEIVEAHRPVEVICDGNGPAAALIPKLEALGIEIRTLTAAEYAQACAAFMDAVNDRAMRHNDTPELNDAVAGAATRPLGERFAWSRKESNVDISPLVAVTVALWAATSTDTESPWDRRAAAGEALL